MTEEEFLAAYDSSAFPKPSVAVDAVLFTIRDDALQVLLTKRQAHPFAGALSLPGVFVGMEETLDEAAQRALREKAGLHDIFLEQLYTWGDPGRDPRLRVISVSYYALVPEIGPLPEGTALYPAHEAVHWALAFDHAAIIQLGLERLRGKVSYTDIAFSLVPEEFTLPQLQRVHELLLGQKLYKANFRKKIAGRIEETGKFTSGGKHRPSRIYRKRLPDEQDAPPAADGAFLL